MARIYSVSHVPPEVNAYGMAKYSRSSAPMRDSLLELSQQKAEQFLNTFYFAYGHASIADLAHVALAIEDISLLAAMDVVDEALWDGQERSTRYQSFDKAAYYQPIGAPDLYHQLNQDLYAHYRAFSPIVGDAYKGRYPMPEGMSAGTYGRTMRARAFDVARYFLPLSTLTSVGQVTNARVLEQQIARLMASPFEELRDIAAQMKVCVTQEQPFDLVVERLRRAQVDIPEAILQELQTGPVLPTLVKYTEPAQYASALRAAMQPIALELLANIPSQATEMVEVFEVPDTTIETVSHLLYQESHLPFEQILQVVQGLAAPVKREILEMALALRGPHDGWPAAFRHAPLLFDVTIDVGAFRDLNRHRRLFKTTQDLNGSMGYDVPEPIINFDMTASYHQAMTSHYEKIQALPTDLQPYVFPLAHRRRVLLAMDWAEAAYLIEQRSKSAGHFSYRRTAAAMYTKLLEMDPVLAQHIRVTPYHDFDPLER